MALSIREMRKVAREAYIAKLGNAPVEQIKTCRNAGVTHERPENLPNSAPVNERKVHWEYED